jgi:hypothetical protein
MADKRGQRQNTHDTGAPTSRPRDDLRTANKRDKPHEQRSEGRDKDAQKAQENDESQGGGNER